MKKTLLIAAVAALLSIQGCKEKADKPLPIAERTVCLDGVTYLKFNEGNHFRGFFAAKFTIESGVELCDGDDRPDIPDLATVCVDNVMYYKFNEGNHYRGFFAPKFNTDSKVMVCDIPLENKSSDSKG